MLFLIVHICFQMSLHWKSLPGPDHQSDLLPTCLSPFLFSQPVLSSSYHLALSAEILLIIYLLASFLPSPVRSESPGEQGLLSCSPIPGT